MKMKFLINPGRGAKRRSSSSDWKAEQPESQAYRGYLIRFNALENLYRVSKDGHHITSGQRLSDVKREIDGLFASNPHRKRAALDTVRRRHKVRSVSSRPARVPVRSRQTTSKVKPMAKRARKRGKGGRFLKAGATRRRRRRVVTRAAAPAAPRRRRRRRSVAVARRRSVSVAAPRRRRRRGFRRNPPNVRSIIGGVVEGLKTGTAVVVGQTGARKIRGAVQGMLPASVNVSSGLGQVGVTLGAAVATSIATRFLPGNLRRFGPFIAAGAFAEAINAAVAQTPIAPFLSAFPARRVVRVGPGARPGVAAWPRQPGLPGARVSAYPTMRTAGLPINAGM